MKFLFLLVNRFNFNLNGIIFYSILNSIFEVISISVLLPLVIILGFDISVNNSILNNIINNEYITSTLLLNLLLLLVVFKISFSIFFARFKSVQIYKTTSKLSNELFKILISNPDKYERDFSKGRAGKLCVVECHNIAQSFLNPIIILISDIFIVALLFAYFIFYNLKLTLFALVLLTCVGVIFKFIVKDNVCISSNKRASSDETRFKLLESFSSLSNYLNSNKKRYWAISKYKENNDVSRDASINYFFWSNFIKSYIEIIIFSVFFLLTFVNLYIYSINLESEFIIVLGFTAVRLLPSVNRLLSSYNSIQYSSAPIKIVSDFLNEFKYHNVNDNLENCVPILKLNNYKYNKNEPYKFITKEFSTGIHFFDGPSGSGKTTLFKNIVNFLPNSNIRNCIEKNCPAFYVSQDNHIINGTLDENILFTKDIISDYNFCNILNVDNFLMQNNISDFGSSLSGGEKQRINVLRGLYSNHDILIFDEPFSSLDVELSKEILILLNDLKRTKCILISSHTLKNEILSISDSKTRLD